MKYKREYWQTIRGICILAVVLIHALGGFDYAHDFNTEFVILRKLINFAVAVFIFMAGYFVPADKMSVEALDDKMWLVNRGGGSAFPL